MTVNFFNRFELWSMTVLFTCKLQTLPSLYSQMFFYHMFSLKWWESHKESIKVKLLTFSNVGVTSLQVHWIIFHPGNAKYFESDLTELHYWGQRKYKEYPIVERLDGNATQSWMQLKLCWKEKSSSLQLYYMMIDHFLPFHPPPPINKQIREVS